MSEKPQCKMLMIVSPLTLQSPMAMRRWREVAIATKERSGVELQFSDHAPTLSEQITERLGEAVMRDMICGVASARSRG